MSNNLIGTNSDSIPANGQDKYKLPRSNSVPNFIKAEQGAGFYVPDNPLTKDRELRNTFAVSGYLDAEKKISDGWKKVLAGITSAVMAVIAFIPCANVALGITLALAGACLIVFGAHSAITGKQEQYKIMPEGDRKQVTEDFQKFKNSLITGEPDSETRKKVADYFEKKEKTANDLRRNLRTARRARNSAEKRQQKIEDEMSDIDVHLNEMRGNLKNKENQLKEIKNLFSQLQKFKANTWDEKYTKLCEAEWERQNTFNALGIGTEEGKDPSKVEGDARQQLDKAKEAAKQKDSNKAINQVRKAEVDMKKARLDAIKEENSKVNKVQAEFDKVNIELNKKMSAVLQGIATTPFFSCVTGAETESSKNFEIDGMEFKIDKQLQLDATSVLGKPGSNENGESVSILAKLGNPQKLNKEELDKTLAFMNKAISTLEQEIESMHIGISWGSKGTEGLLNDHIAQENTRNEAEKKIREIESKMRKRGLNVPEDKIPEERRDSNDTLNLDNLSASFDEIPNDTENNNDEI